MPATRAVKAEPKTAPKPGFGSTFVGEMVVAEFSDGSWSAPRIEPYHSLTLDPATTCLHYGQTIFEGLKGHRQPDGDTAIFRLRDHMERFNRSAQRMCMPPIDPDVTTQAVIDLVSRHTSETPETPGALYIRPMMIATAVGMGVKPANSYAYLVLLCPVGSYFGTKKGIRMVTEERYVRAAPGGTGAAKCGGNYAASMIAQSAALGAGFDQVLWLDYHEHKYVEELSAMNFLMVEDGVLISPPDSDTVLASLTNRSIFTLAADLGLRAQRRAIPIESVGSPSVTEVFCCGTAAVITPVFELVHHDRVLFASDKRGPVATQLYDALTGVQQGRDSDPHGWRTCVGNPAPFEE